MPAALQASKLVFASRLTQICGRTTGSNNNKFLKELPGRPYSARREGSRQVLLPFLTRISTELYHHRLAWTTPDHSLFVRDPKFRRHSVEYQKRQPSATAS